jgi:alpha-L-rhamnosidase
VKRLGLWFALLPLAVLGLAAEKFAFVSAKPIWPEGRQTEKNIFVGFRAELEAPPESGVLLRVTASSVYRAFLNGEFLGYGPARGPHGYYRVDEWDLGRNLRPGTNTVVIEVAGYNVNSYYLLDQPAFLQAEVVGRGRTLASTAGDGAQFTAAISKERIQKVERYSFQRPFTEAYRLSPGDRRQERASCEIVGTKRLLPRRVPYPNFALRGPVSHEGQGTIRTGVEPVKLWKDRSLIDIGPKLGGYKEQELELIPSIDLQKIVTARSQRLREPYAGEKLHLGPETFHVLDFGTNLTGFIGLRLTVRKPTQLYVTFDEILTNDDVDFKRLSCVNAVTYELAPGTYDLESFEPYTLRFLKPVVTEGDCDIERVYLREYANSDVWTAQFASSDDRLNRLFDAGRETFRQNAVDVFTDCPSRERAGWLCDSFFTARVAHVLSGDARVEKNFFENYLLPQRFEYLPDGMLPEAYPADHNDGVFIPNWALWFVVQLEEYLHRSGDRELVDAMRPRVMRLFEYFRPFRNQDGLLEKLKSWVFIEWSAANEFTQDVNYPSNMLYAGAMAAAARMYDVPEMQAESERIREVIRRQSFDADFFVDNALRDGTALKVTRNRTEVCQYFAFFFDVATPATHEALWRKLQTEFGPDRKRRGLYPEIHPANSFVGNVLRLELLSRYGFKQQAMEESRDYLLYMADRTGTLWENINTGGSLNHGFASHVVYSLYRDVLGLSTIDWVNKSVHVTFSKSDLEWCEGRVPVPDGAVSLRWAKQGGNTVYQLHVPAGYLVQIDNRSGRPLRSR